MAKNTANKFYIRKKTGRMIPCPGEAHRNAHIDNCGMCMPRWGEIEEVAPIDFAEAERLNLPIRCPDLNSDEENRQVDALLKAGKVRLESVTVKNRSFNVLVWV